MKNPHVSLLFGLLLLIYACSDTQEKEQPYKSTLKAIDINDFIPSHVGEVPNIEIKPAKYFNHIVGKYRVDTHIDSIHTNAIYWKIKNKSENVVYKGYASDCKKNGWWEVLRNKTLICSGNYISNKKCGFWRYYNLEGASQIIVNYTNDTLVGLAQAFSAKNILLSEGNYIKGFKSDYWKYFYDNGKIKAQGYFYDGYKSGWWQSFESNGNLKEEASYSRDEISGYMKKYLNGVIFEEGKLFNGRRRGTWKIYDHTGKLNRIEEYGEK